MISPGAFIGITGGGQLGRMTALAARQMGYGILVFEERPWSPASFVADRTYEAPYDDPIAIEEFCRDAAVVTYEFENIPLRVMQQMELRVPVRPAASVLEICQNRQKERRFFEQQKVPQPWFRLVSSQEELRGAMAEMPPQTVLKNARFGYDGKGQRRISPDEDAGALWQEIGGQPAVIEEWLDLECEISVICARSRVGNVVMFPVQENRHRNHILDMTIVPARVKPGVADQAREIAHSLANSLGVIGLLTVEFFVTRDSRVLVNEMAPRPHNSGHYSIEACVTSQFEQHVRTICDLPLGSSALIKPAVMLNLLGDFWKGSTPNWAQILNHPRAKLHLYGKREPRSGRKMGHVTILGEEVEEAVAEAKEIRQTLS